MTATEITQTGYSQGFRHFFKAVDAFFFGAARHLSSAEDRSYLAGRTLRNAVSSIFCNPRISFPGKAGVRSNSEKWLVIIIKQISI